MKKLCNFVKVLILVVSLSLFVANQYGGIIVYAQNSPDTLSYTEAGGNRYVYELENYMGKVSPAVMRKFKELGWNVLIVSEDELAAVCGVGEYSGSISYKEQTIYILNGKWDVDSLFHEIGHFISYTYTPEGDIAGSPEFLALFAEESANYTAYGQTDSYEFFAEVVYGLYRTPGYVKKACPKTSAYIENIIETYR